MNKHSRAFAHTYLSQCVDHFKSSVMTVICSSIKTCYCNLVTQVKKLHQYFFNPGICTSTSVKTVCSFATSAANSTFFKKRHRHGQTSQETRVMINLNDARLQQPDRQQLTKAVVRIVASIMMLESL